MAFPANPQATSTMIQRWCGITYPNNSRATPTTIESLPMEKFEEEEKTHSKFEKNEPAPYEITDHGVFAYNTYEREKNIIDSRIIADVPFATVDYVYTIRNTFNTLMFLHNLLIWTTELVDNHIQEQEKNKILLEQQHKLEDNPSKRSRLNKVSAKIVKCKNIYNSLTATTLIYRKIRREFMTSRDPRALNHERLRDFIKQVDKTIVSSLMDIGFLASYSTDSTPPREILENLGLSRELCILANIELLYHTPGTAPENLLKNGLDIRYAKHGSFGRGLYFANNPKKAMTYFRSDWGVNPDVHHPEHRYMVLCLVALGRVKVYEPAELDKALFREPDGYDSIIGTPKDLKEIVVYNSKRVLLNNVVYYNINDDVSLYQISAIRLEPPRIPNNLKKFCNSLIQRASEFYLDADIRLHIINLINKKYTTQYFVRKISMLLNASVPHDLAENIDKALKQIQY